MKGSLFVLVREYPRLYASNEGYTAIASREAVGLILEVYISSHLVLIAGRIGCLWHNDILILDDK